MAGARWYHVSVLCQSSRPMAAQGARFAGASASGRFELAALRIRSQCDREGHRENPRQDFPQRIVYEPAAEGA